MNQQNNPLLAKAKPKLAKYYHYFSNRPVQKKSMEDFYKINPN